MVGRDWQQAMQMAAQAGTADDGRAAGLAAPEWKRLAVLMAFVTPMPHAQAASLPLCVLPPNRLRLLNPAQGLQALVTHRLGEPGWCRSMHALADRLPGAQLRHDFNQLVNALLPRSIGMAGDGERGALRRAREDAWGDALVNRRWQRLMLQLDVHQTKALLAHGVAMGLAGVHARLHDDDSATDGWALHPHGDAPRLQRAAIEPAPVPRSTLRAVERPARRASDRPAPRLVAQRAAAPASQAKTATT